MAGRNDSGKRARQAQDDQLPRGRTIWKREKPPEQHAEKDVLHPDFKYTCWCGWSGDQPLTASHRHLKEE